MLRINGSDAAEAEDDWINIDDQRVTSPKLPTTQLIDTPSIITNITTPFPSDFSSSYITTTAAPSTMSVQTVESLLIQVEQEQKRRQEAESKLLTSESCVNQAQQKVQQLNRQLEQLVNENIKQQQCIEELWTLVESFSAVNAATHTTQSSARPVTNTNLAASTIIRELNTNGCRSVSLQAARHPRKVK